MTAQGHPRAVFLRAVERGNLLVAEATAREIGQVSLAEALELTALIAVQQPERAQRAAGRWLERFVVESATGRLVDVVLVSALLQALGTHHHDQALSLLREIVGTTSRGRR